MPNGGHSAKRTPLDAVKPYQSLPSVCLCRVQVFAECQALGKGLFAECHILLSVALGKAGLCRVPEIWHSAKIFALGKSHVSRSVPYTFIASEKKMSLCSIASNFKPCMNGEFAKAYVNCVISQQSRALICVFSMFILCLLQFMECLVHRPPSI